MDSDVLKDGMPSKVDTPPDDPENVQASPSSVALKKCPVRNVIGTARTAQPRLWTSSLPLRLTCDNCDAAIKNDHYHCSICNQGDYDLCPSCVDSGFRCLDPGHCMVKQSISKGNLLGSSTEHTDTVSYQKIISSSSLQYTALEHPNIRLISIDPPTQDGKLQLSMRTVPLDDQLDFHALSYVWGTTKDMKGIIINEKHFKITQNLYDFLNSTRRHGSAILEYHNERKSSHEDNRGPVQPKARGSDADLSRPVERQVYWWIDAICINQSDTEEKNEQIPRMGDIYSMATRVWVWMGLPSKIWKEDKEFTALRLALDFHTEDCARMLGSKGPFETPIIERFSRYQRQKIIQRVVKESQALTLESDMSAIIDILERDYTRFANITSSENPHSFFLSFLDQFVSLVTQPYFKRIWIIQEFVLNPKSPVALLGRFPLDLKNLCNLALRVFDERSQLDEHTKARSETILDVSADIIILAQIRRLWHDLPAKDRVDRVAPITTSLTRPEVILPSLPAGEKLCYLLHAFMNRKCTNRHDHFYGLFGLVDCRELPDYLKPDYNLSFGEISWRFTRYIIQSTQDVRLIESWMDLDSPGYPSWVPHVKHLSPVRGSPLTVSKELRYFHLSDDGRRLTLEGAQIGNIIACSCAARPNIYMDAHLEFVDEILIEGASQITGKPKTEIFRSWLQMEMFAEGHEMHPERLADINSMEKLLQCYREFLRDVPKDVQDILHNGTAQQRAEFSQYSVSAKSPFSDPQFFVAVLSLSASRYCLLSSGHISRCGMKDTLGSRDPLDHRWDDSVWALKGLIQLSILRPTNDQYEYYGALHSAEVFRNTHEFDLDDSFFAKRDLRRVVLV